MATARAQMAASIGYWRDIDNVEQLISTDENVLRMAAGQWGAQGGVLVLTERHIAFVAADTVQWAIERRLGVSVRCDCGVCFGVITVTTGDFRATVRHVARTDAAALVRAAGGRCRSGAVRSA